MSAVLDGWGDQAPKMTIVPSRWLIIVRDDKGRTIAQYDLSMPERGKPGFATQVTAFNQFREAELARTQIMAVKRCTFTDWNYANEIKIVRPICKRTRSLWDLFRAIGYDHKTRSYK
jgi:hypothetical protein